MKKSKNFDGQRARNPVETDLSFSGTYWKMTKHWLFGKEIRRPTKPIEIVSLDRAVFEQPWPEGLRITWMGHSTVLIEIDGCRVLTDPVFEKRVSPSAIMGPKRFYPPPISRKELPPLDAVVISHDHYDHLEKSSIQALARTGVRFFMPLGIGAHLERWGVDPAQIFELDWWDSAETEDGVIKLTATPARHFSGRGLGMNKTQWASFVIAGPHNRVFFSGDNGFSPVFAEIGEKLGPFQLTLIESGAYGKLWPHVHLFPEQTVQAHIALRGELLMPIHWGTFNLAFHNWFDPPNRLLAAASESSVRVVIPRPGQMFEPSDPPATERWWEQDQ